MEIVEVDLNELGSVDGPPFEGREAFVVAHRGGAFVGTCFARWAGDGRTLAAAIEHELEGVITTRAVERSVGVPAAWLPPVEPHTAEPVSVVVTTCDRPVELRRCLASVAPQLREGDELLVVDNSPAGSAAGVAAAFGAACEREHRPGSGWTRNRGLERSTHDVVVFLDDDCVADRGWLDAMRSPFRDASVDVVTGAVLARRADLLVPCLVDERQPYHRGWTSRRFHGTTATCYSPHDPWVVGTGACMAWRRGALSALGGFDPALGSGTPMRASEELDAFRRLIARGGVVVYEPAALVRHDHPETMRALRRKLLSYAVGSGAHLAKVLLEERHGRRVALRMTWHDVQWRWRSLADEATHAALGRPHLPLLALAGHPAGVAVGVTRFVRHRSRVRQAR